MPIQRHPESSFHEFNGQRYHVRLWRGNGTRQVFLLHGWMDCADSFQFLVDALPQEWTLIAPDWRGFGRSAWNTGSYYFPDYLADLDALLDHYSPGKPAQLVGHSMGGIITLLYGGIRPDRVAQLISLEGLGLPETHPNQAPNRYARWLDECRQPPGFAAFENYDQIAARLRERSSRLSAENALYLAEALAESTPQGVRYRADPRHKMVNPVLYRLEETKACWRRIKAPVLWLIGSDTWDHPIAQGVFETLDERRACFAQLEETVIAEAGHMMHWEQPQACAAAIRHFLEP